MSVAARPAPPGVRTLWLSCLAVASVAVFAPAAFAQTQQALQFNGTSQYVTFGPAPDMGASVFTIEVRFKRTGTGATTSTGTGGVTAVPLLTKGRGEAEGSTVDMNYFLGIDATGKLVADYEEGTGQLSPGLNHPVTGSSTIVNDVWYHAAASFDGTNLRVYLNGSLEGTTTVSANRLPQSASIQHGALGTAMTSTGVTQGFFQGILDEARVWNVARSGADLSNNMGVEILSGPGLIARWGLNEGTGINAGNSIANGTPGTLTGPPVWTADSPLELADEAALSFGGGNNAYVRVADAAALRVSAVTIEMWIRRDGAGVGTNTGSGGIPDAIPLLAKGRAETETATTDINYLLGIRASDGVLCADFEEGQSGAAPSLNHPIAGDTPIGNGVWHHVAATYDGTWKLYLDGVLDQELVVGQPLASASTVAVGIASALTSANVAAGFFHGAIDEVRIWNVARTEAQIQANMNARLATPTAGLVARWSLDEDAQLTVASTAGTTLNGIINGTSWSWAGPAPFNAVVPSPPNAPTALSAVADGATQIDLAWTDNADNEGGFEIERSTTGSGGPFTPLAAVGANVVAYSDNGLSPSTQYCYQVRAVNGGGNSSFAGPSCATTASVPNMALDFVGTSGSNAYVTFGDAPALHLTAVTMEMWIRRDGAGIGTDTGSNGIIDAIPLMAKGRAETENAAVDINYLLGIKASNNLLCADFEEGAGGATPSGNHPIFGVTPIANGVWHHVAATYDGAIWKLYLDGMLENELTVGQPLGSGSNVGLAIASALNSTGVASGFFNGVMDEVRLWNVARTQAQIQSTANAQITVATPGLVGRWALDEGTGTLVSGSAGTAVNGAVTSTGFAWVGGAPFNLTFNQPPAAPTVIVPANNATGVSTGPSLYVGASDAEGGTLTVTWHGRPVNTAPGPDFTLIGLPDTQYYTGALNGGHNGIFKAQTNWVVGQRATRNIVAAVQLGDCTEHGDNGGDPIEWMRADTSLSIIENALTTGLPEGIPYGVCVGNHDQSPIGDADGTTNFYNQYFGISRFQDRDYYGGHYGSTNDNWYTLFSASGMDFILIGFEYDTTPDAAVLAWADQLLTTFSSRRAIVATHNLIGAGNPAAFSTQGQAIYNALRAHPNLFLMLGGHVSTEGRRQDTFAGNTVHSLLSDYQGRTNGGNGWLRIMEFSPANNVIRVRTYSPTLNQFEADSDSSSQFTLPYAMSSAAPFQVIGSASVPSGGNVSMVWSGLSPSTEYEWYATVSDGSVTTVGPTWRFTTSATVGVGDPPITELELAPIAPNPASGRAHVTFMLPRATPVKLSLMDIQGREIAVLAEGMFEAGRHPVSWNGRAGGGTLHSGIYLVRLQTPGRSVVRKFVWAR